MNRSLCFATDFEKVAKKMTDYMNHYFSEVAGKKGYSYDNSKSFQEKENSMKELLLSETKKLSQVNFDEMDINPALIAKNPNIQWAAMAVVETLIDMILPDVLIKDMERFVDFRNINAGDSASFNIPSNDLFFVSKAGRNKRVTEFQRQYSGTVTITPEVRQLTVGTNLYKTICGIESMAEFTMKAILSLESNVRKEVYGALNTAMLALPSTPTDGNLLVAGYDKTSAIKLAQRVQTFNNGAKPIFLGTKAALNTLTPNDSNFRYEEDSSLFKLGYIPTNLGYDMLELEQVADWKNKYKTVLNDDIIYVICPSAGKLIRFVYEGIPSENNIPYTMSADNTNATSIMKSYGFAICTPAIAGSIRLA